MRAAVSSIVLLLLLFVSSVWSTPSNDYYLANATSIGMVKSNMVVVERDKQLSELCVSANNDYVTGYRVQWYETERVVDVGRVDQPGHVTTCFSFEDDEKIVFFRHFTTVSDKRVSQVYFVTTLNNHYSFPNNQTSSDAVTEYYYPEGAYFAGLGTLLQGNETYGLEIFVLESDVTPDIVYGTPVGDYETKRSIVNVKEAYTVCCWVKDEFVSAISISGNTGSETHGTVNPLVPAKCINVQAKKVNWQAAKAIDNGDIGIGFLKITTDDEQSIECKGSTNSTWGPVQEMIGFETLSGIFVGTDDTKIKLLGPILSNAPYLHSVQKVEGGNSNGDYNFFFKRTDSFVQQICFSWNSSVLTGLSFKYTQSEDKIQVGTESNTPQCINFESDEKVVYWNTQGVDGDGGRVGRIRIKTSKNQMYDTPALKTVLTITQNGIARQSDSDYFSFKGTPLLGFVGFEKKGTIQNIGPIFLTQRQESSMEYPLPSGDPLDSFTFNVENSQLTEICCHFSSKYVLGLSAKDANRKKYYMGVATGAKKCINISNQPVKWLSKASKVDKSIYVGLVSLSTAYESITCSADPQYIIANKAQAFSEWTRLKGFYGSHKKALVQIAPILDKKYLFAKNEKEVGALAQNNYNLTVENYQVKQLCFEYTTSNVHIRKISVSWYGTETVKSVGTAGTGTASGCFTLSEGELIRYMRLTGTSYLQGLFGRIEIMTTNNRVFSTPAITNAIQTVNFQNNQVESVFEFFDYYGRILIGFYGFVDGFVQSAGASFVGALYQTRPGYYYPIPTGNLAPVTHNFIDGTSVEEICCWNDANGVRGVYMKTTNNFYFIGVRVGNTNCIKVDNAPVSVHLRKSSALGGLLGMFKIVRQTTSLVCQANSNFLTGPVTSNTDPRKLSGFLASVAPHNGADYIDMLAPVWPNNILSTVLIQYTLDIDSSTVKNSQPKEVTKQELMNRSLEPQSISITGEYATSFEDTITTSQAISTTSSHEVNTALSVQIEIGALVGAFGIMIGAALNLGVSVGGSVTSSLGFEKTWTNTRSLVTEEIMSYEFPISVPANSTASCSIMYYEITKDIRWRGIVQYMYLDGSTEFAAVDGIYTSMANRYLMASVSEIIPIGNVPNNKNI